MNIQKIREDFPILGRTVYDKLLVYLNSGVATQKPRSVIDPTVDEYYSVNANTHRGVHFLSRQAAELHEASRETVRQPINARSIHEVTFARGTTESINLIVSSLGEEFMQEEDEVIISVMEHYSSIVLWQLLVVRRGTAIKAIPMNDKGELLLDEYEKLFSEYTKIVSVTQVSNVLGTTSPAKEMIATAHAHGVPVVIDGVQFISHMKVDVQKLDADFSILSGHKIYGPTGIGVLYGKKDQFERPSLYQGGGEIIQSVSFEKTVFDELPLKFRAGAPDYTATTGPAKALDYVTDIGLDHVADHEHEPTIYAMQRPEGIPGMRISGEATYKSSVAPFLVGDIHHLDMGTLLDRLGIAVRTGHHCAEPLMYCLGIEGTARASFAMYNTKEEIDDLVAGIERVSKMF